MKLYELTSADGRLFSPYCLAVRACLVYKEIEFVSVPLSFTDIRNKLKGLSKTVPVLCSDAGEYVTESFEIAKYLDKIRSNRVKLFLSERDIQFSYAFDQFILYALRPLVVKYVVNDVLKILCDEDKKSFKESREARFKVKKLEDLEKHKQDNLKAILFFLRSIVSILDNKRYLFGDNPCYCDFLVYSVMMFASMPSRSLIIDEKHELFAWFKLIYDNQAEEIKIFDI